jgi:tRNA uridine 5-carboxymethylaminomethyl modification enzyme
VLRRPEESFDSVAAAAGIAELEGLSFECREAVEIDIKYEGYIARQAGDVARMTRQESTEIPRGLDYSQLDGLGNEAREKLMDLRPRTLGAASRIEGVRPPDVALIGVHVARLRASSG